MPDSHDLTIAYLSTRPESAGRTLAAMPSAEAAAFLQNIPTRYATKAVAGMNALRASMLVQQMGVTAGAALIRELGFTEAAMLLRQITPANREPFLDVLPRKLKRDFETTLAFPAGSVGAHMTMSIATLKEDELTGVALDLIRRAEPQKADVIFVVDDRRRLVGAVAASALLQHPASTPLRQILDTTCVALSAYERLDAVADLDAWHDYSRLPVVTRRGEVYGTIARRALRQLQQDASESSASRQPSLTGALLEALATSTGGLLDVLLASHSRPTGQEAPHES